MQNKKYVCEVYSNTRSTNQSTFLNSFMPLVFLYPQKTSNNQRFSDVFRGYRKKPVVRNGSMNLYLNLNRNAWVCFNQVIHEKSKT